MPWDKHKRAMVVVAHPDDAEFGFAGTLARLTREGMELAYVLCTDGDKGTSDPGHDLRAAGRHPAGGAARRLRRHRHHGRDIPGLRRR